MQSMKETASNIVASAKAGMEKTKATVQEKVEKMSTSDAMEKDRATHKKEDRINQAEMHKHEFQESNAAATHGAATGGDSSDFSSGTRHGAGGITSDYSSTGGYTAGSGGVGTGGAATTYGGRNDDLLTGGQSATKAGGYSTGDDYGITGGGAGIGSAGYSSGGTGMMGGNEYGTAGHHAGGGVGGLGSEYGSGERGGITDSEYGIGGKHTAAGGGIMDSEYGIGGTNTAAGYGRDSSTTVYDGMDSDEMRETRRHGYETRGSNRKQGGGSDY